jgi:hypothetical protein
MVMSKLGPVLRAIALAGNLAAFAAVFSPAACFAESRLPPCPSSDPTAWTECQASQTYADGGKYVGEFRKGKPSGQGQQIYSDGRKYVGEWRDGKLNGQGSLTYPHSGQYVGNFRDNKPEGQGTYSYPDGRKYTGEWRDGKFNGQGTLTYPDGRKDVGEFRENRLVGASSTDMPSVISEAPKETEDNSLLLVAMVVLAAGGLATAVMNSRSKASLVTPMAGSTGHDGDSGRSRVDDALRALLEVADDFSIPDGKLLELRRDARRALEELGEANRIAPAKKDLLSFLKFR